MATTVTETLLHVIDQVQITTLTAVKGLGVIPNGTEYVEIQAVGANVRVNFKRNGVPSATVGYLLLDGTPGRMIYTNPNDITFIESGGTATLEVVYLKNRDGNDS